MTASKVDKPPRIISAEPRPDVGDADLEPVDSAPVRARRYEQHLSDNDAFFWGVEKDRQLRNTIIAVFVLDKAPDRSVVLDRLERASRQVPGWRHRLVTPPLRLANPRWVLDPDFNLSYHVRWIGAPKEKTFESVLAYASTHMMSGLDRDRPLWTFTIVDGLEDDQATLIIKIHHTLTDGVGGIALLPLILDMAPDAPERGALPPLPPADDMGQRALAIDALSSNRERLLDLVRDGSTSAFRGAPNVLRDPLAAARSARRNLQALGRILTPPSEALSPLMRDRRGWSHFATLDADLAALHRAAKPRGATVNDAFVTAIGWGFARYHERLGAPVAHLRVTMAVSNRKPGDPVQGNRVMGGHFPLPVGTSDPAGQMQEAHELIKTLRDDVGQPLTKVTGPMVNVIGPLASGSVGKSTKNCDLALTNVPGLEVPIWFGGAEVLAMYGFGPDMGTATNATLLSYRGTAHVGLNIDTAAVTDVDLLVDCVRKGLAAVVALADA